MLATETRPLSLSDEDRAHHRLRCELAGVPWRELRPPRSAQAVLNGVRLHWLDWGDPAAPPVVLLHGGGQTARTWDLVCHELSAERRCIALDQRGHGDSEWAADLDYRFTTRAGDVEALADALALERPVLVGMSMGAIAALHCAVRRPEHWAGLVSVDAGPWVAVEEGRSITAFLDDVGRVASIDAAVERARRFNPRRDPRLLRRSLLHNLRPHPDGGWAWKTDRRRPLRLGDLEADLERLRPRLDRIACPVLVVRGAESRVFSDADARRLAESVPDGRRVTIDGAGHSVQGDNPAALIAKLQDFLDALPRG